MDLPKKEPTLTVHVADDDDSQPIEFIVRTLSDEQFYHLFNADSAQAREQVRKELEGEATDSEGEVPQDIKVTVSYSQVANVFASNVQGLAPGGTLTIEGEPFDPDNPAHLDSVPSVWKMTCINELLSYNLMPKKMAGNSRKQDEPSPSSETPMPAGT